MNHRVLLKLLLQELYEYVDGDQWDESKPAEHSRWGNNFIPLIKVVRTTLPDIWLKDAKDLVEKMFQVVDAVTVVKYEGESYLVMDKRLAHPMKKWGGEESIFGKVLVPLSVEAVKHAIRSQEV